MKLGNPDLVPDKIETDLPYDSLIMNKVKISKPKIENHFMLD